MDTIVDNITFIEQVTNLYSLNQIIETILVDENQGSINVQKTVKLGDSVKVINEDINYKLESTRLIIKSDNEFTQNIVISDIDIETIMNNKSLCECIARNTNNIFGKEFSKFKDTINHTINYFNQGFLQKIFNKTKNEEVISKIEELSRGNSWMIIPQKFVEIFRNSSKFQENKVENPSLIYNFGSIDDYQVYLNPNQRESKIYFGNYDSITLLVNRNLSTEDLKTNSSTYTQSMNMGVNYLFIQNRPLSVLEIQ
jgi:hypothetical protein